MTCTLISTRAVGDPLTTLLPGFRSHLPTVQVPARSDGLKWERIDPILNQLLSIWIPQISAAFVTLARAGCMPPPGQAKRKTPVPDYGEGRGEHLIGEGRVPLPWKNQGVFYVSPPAWLPPPTYPWSGAAETMTFRSGPLRDASRRNEGREGVISGPHVLAAGILTRVWYCGLALASSRPDSNQDRS